MYEFCTDELKNNLNLVRASFEKQNEEKKTEDEHDENLHRKIGTGLETGNYELVGVLTHKGYTPDVGHYVAWVHKKGGNLFA